MVVLQAELAGASSTAAQPSRARAQEEEDKFEPEGSEVSYGSDEPPQQDQSDADSDDGERLILAFACEKIKRCRWSGMKVRCSWECLVDVTSCST